MIWRWITGKYYARLRRLDIEILWPEMVKQAANEYYARSAMLQHAAHDPAWLFLGWDEIERQVDLLPYTNSGE